MRAFGRGHAKKGMRKAQWSPTSRPRYDALVLAGPPRAASLQVMLFWILLGIDAAVALVIAYFFFAGLADGSVSSFNMTLWLAIIGGVAGVLGGGWLLRAKGQRGAANGVMALLAVPGFLFGLFILLLIIVQPRWN